MARRRATVRDDALVRALVHEPFAAAQQDASTPRQRAAAAAVTAVYARLQEETCAGRLPRPSLPQGAESKGTPS
jgi:hypothetical protein